MTSGAPAGNPAPHPPEMTSPCCYLLNNTRDPHTHTHTHTQIHIHTHIRTHECVIEHPIKHDTYQKEQQIYIAKARRYHPSPFHYPNLMKIIIKSSAIYPFTLALMNKIFITFFSLLT